MRGGLYQRLIHLSLLVILIRLAGQNGSALPYRLLWLVPRATSSDAAVCAWVCCNPQIAHRDRRSLFLAGFAGFAQCNGNRLLTAFDLRAFAGAWLAALQRAAFVFAHHLGDLGLGFGWLFHGELLVSYFEELFFCFCSFHLRLIKCTACDTLRSLGLGRFAHFVGSS